MPYTESLLVAEDREGGNQEPPDFFSAVLGAYPEQGFDRGYEHAMHGLLAALVPLTERYLARQGDRTGETRRLVYRYVEFLENHIRRVSEEARYVSDGLGI